MTRLTVNGREVSLTLPEKTPLLHALRGELGLFGAKLGCGQGNCGACTVIVNDRAVQSCQTPLWSLDGASVRTVEGLDADDPVRAAFLDAQAAQCGYCIPGILMTVRAMLDAEPGDRKGVVETLGERHLCRCGTHVRILAATRKALGEGPLESAGESG